MSNVEQLYFEWMCNMLDPEKNYQKLLSTLYFKERFIPTLERDENRATDGLNLRYRFAYLSGIPYPEVAAQIDHRDCSMLEMMLALAIRCEEDITYDSYYGDRTAMWFWNMVESLGLKEMDDWHFYEDHVHKTIEWFLSRQYLPDGEGGLFTIKNTKEDLRQIEIWNQMCRYLNSRGSN